MATFEFKPKIGSETAISNQPIKQGQMFISSNGDKLYFDPTDNKRFTVEDKTFVYTQQTESNEWEIKHDLNKFPSVIVVDSAGTLIQGEITYTDNNNISINFSSAISGKAYLN